MRKLTPIAAILALGIAAGAPAAKADMPARTVIAALETGRAELAPIGIELVALRVSAHGYLLDLRFRVVDIDKARSAMRETTPITLIDPVSGAVLAVPRAEKLGLLRSTAKRAQNGQILSSLFANSGHRVKAGDTVNLKIGTTTVSGIKVEG
jgi:hypothetical protein